MDFEFRDIEGVIRYYLGVRGVYQGELKQDGLFRFSVLLNVSRALTLTCIGTLKRRSLKVSSCEILYLEFGLEVIENKKCSAKYLLCKGSTLVNEDFESLIIGKECSGKRDVVISSTLEDFRLKVLNLIQMYTVKIN